MQGFFEIPTGHHRFPKRYGCLLRLKSQNRPHQWSWRAAQHWQDKHDLSIAATCDIHIGDSWVILSVYPGSSSISQELILTERQCKKASGPQTSGFTSVYCTMLDLSLPNLHSPFMELTAITSAIEQEHIRRNFNSLCRKLKWDVAKVFDKRYLWGTHSMALQFSRRSKDFKELFLYSWCKKIKSVKFLLLYFIRTELNM